MRNLIKWTLLLVLIGSMFVAIGQNTSLTQYFKEAISTNDNIPIQQQNLENSVVLSDKLVASDCDIDNDNELEKENIAIKQSGNKSLHRKAATLNAEFREKGYDESARVVIINDKEVIQVVKKYTKEDLPIQVTKTK